MFRVKKLAPAQIMSMSEKELAEYEAAVTKAYMIKTTIVIAGVVALRVLTNSAIKAADKKLEEHYTREQD
jgi:hypothetical protein